MPAKKQARDRIPEDTMTPPKLLNTRMEERQGNITRLEMSMAPIILIPSTMVTAVRTAMMIL